MSRPSSPSCPCLIWVRVVSCQPKSMALPSSTMGWHEHWDALCCGINSSSTRRHWTKDVRIDHPPTLSLDSPRPPRRPQTLPVPEVAMPPPAWGTEASEHKANLMPSALRNPPVVDSSTRQTLYDPCRPRWPLRFLLVDRGAPIKAYSSRVKGHLKGTPPLDGDRPQDISRNVLA